MKYKNSSNERKNSSNDKKNSANEIVQMKKKQFK